MEPSLQLDEGVHAMTTLRTPDEILDRILVSLTRAGVPACRPRGDNGAIDAIEVVIQLAKLVGIPVDEDPPDLLAGDEPVLAAVGTPNYRLDLVDDRNAVWAVSYITAVDDDDARDQARAQHSIWKAGERTRVEVARWDAGLATPIDD
jgi:hypothetical protein